MSRKFEQQYSDPKGVLINKPGVGVLLAAGTTVPSDGAAGFAFGCIFIHTDGAAGTDLYRNVGSDTSADFNVVSGVDLSALTATAAELNAAADVSARLVTVPDGAAYTVLAANSGKPHAVSEQTASVTLDLPAAAAGLEFEFFMKGVATEAQNWVFDTGAATNFYLGGLQFLDSDEPGSGSTLVPVYPNGSTNDIMTIITPQAGTWIKLYCDGTNWIVTGTVYSATAPTFGDT